MDWFGIYRNHTPITEELADYIRRVTLREPAHEAHRKPPFTRVLAAGRALAIIGLETEPSDFGGWFRNAP
jgi:hypothetical protein